MHKGTRVAVACAAIAAIFWPREAMAAESASQLCSNTAAAAIVAGVVIAAFFVNRFAPKKRRHVRSTAILGLLYLVAFGAFHLCVFLGAPGPERIAQSAAELFGVLTVV